MMDPQGYFSGSTLYANWKAVEGSNKYSVAVEKCDEQSICNQVYHDLVDSSSVSESSPEFDACTIYRLKV